MKKLEELGISKCPWTFCKPIDNARCIVRNFLGKIIVGYTNRANAHLISAAPDMYVALRKITKEQECGKDCAKCNNHGCVIKECKAALAKAAGEEAAK